MASNPLRRGTSADAEAAAGLHIEQIPEGFLATLGPRFLRRLYSRTARFPGSFLLVTTDACGVNGFIAVAEATGRLYREFLLRDGVGAALSAAPSLLRDPRRVWETFRYGSGNATTDLPPAEILAVAVAARARRQGIGTALVEGATAELHRRGSLSARVVTGSTNDAAIRMYERAGFHRHSTIEVHAGEPQEVLVWG